jgi:hypothetical protein
VGAKAPTYIYDIKLKRMIKLVRQLVGYVRCKVCGRDCRNVGAGTVVRGMCERCYENGGDDY